MLFFNEEMRKNICLDCHLPRAIGMLLVACYMQENNIQLTLVISNSKELTETLRDIRTSTYQS